MKHVYEDIRELIGNTPMMKIKNFPMPNGVNIYAKLEFFNPGGSVKDRLGMALIQDGEEKGVLKPGQDNY